MKVMKLVIKDQTQSEKPVELHLVQIGDIVYLKANDKFICAVTPQGRLVRTLFSALEMTDLSAMGFQMEMNRVAMD
ncbi:hypothetical protein C4565_00365 [Candidatus Parcubacteria bacterium]|nr:MAG: hypothetical protein C4565_00365 [Candidatus Parcubacteria bacterium]